MKMRFFLVFRCFWIVSLLLAFVACVMLIINLITKLQAFPIIICMGENSISVTEIPFPAITLCPSLNMDVDEFDYETIARNVKSGNLSIEDLPTNV